MIYAGQDLTRKAFPLPKTNINSHTCYMKELKRIEAPILVLAVINYEHTPLND
ncbi:hypothetical protein Nwat_2592 [Nitrosococcus watsonii C-113]|uniref:Uncharacterized protein n=1 Tax=Nitrosococcus watsoni (strain C-113) TaxID=105559 RepID=D8KA16_NITWC|nr:hypothetical protein Nwat_2592 [Nitrosococcus watsonii C-113]